MNINTTPPPRHRLLCRWLACGLSLASAIAATADAHDGGQIYRRFREGLAQPQCDPSAAAGHTRQFAKTPQVMADGRHDVMPLFGYVVDTLRAAGLPTEYALIPFVESGYRPAARSPSGPAGLWQMIALTARDHGVPMRAGFDGRLSPAESTRAAVRYLKTLHGMFAGDWRLAAMAYNAGEYRILAALKNSGQRARDVDLKRLAGVPAITRDYVGKLHALSCILGKAEAKPHWRAAIARPVPRLADQTIPAGADLDAWAADNGLDGDALRRIDPTLADRGRIRARRHILAPHPSTAGSAAAISPQTPARTHPTQPGPEPRRHTVRRGETAAAIARRYRMPTRQLLERNGLHARSILRPGMRLKLE